MPRTPKPRRGRPPFPAGQAQDKVIPIRLDSSTVGTIERIRGETPAATWIREAIHQRLDRYSRDG